MNVNGRMLPETSMRSTVILSSLFVIFFRKCRYQQLNKRALEDAELYFRTRRVRAPSPTHLSESDDHVGDLEKESDEGKEVKEPSRPSVVTTGGKSEQGLVLPSPELHVLSSDSDDDVCRCEELSQTSKQDASSMTASDSTSSGTNSSDSTSCGSDSDFHASDCDSESETSGSKTSSEDVDVEEDYPWKTTMTNSRETGTQAVQGKKQKTGTSTSRNFQRTCKFQEEVNPLCNKNVSRVVVSGHERC